MMKCIDEFKTNPLFEMQGIYILWIDEGLICTKSFLIIKGITTRISD